MSLAIWKLIYALVGRLPLDGLNDWVGTPDTSWLEPLKPVVRKLTGMARGIGLVGGAVILIVALAMVAFGFKKATGLLRTALIGIGLLTIGVTILLALLTALMG